MHRKIASLVPLVVLAACSESSQSTAPAKVAVPSASARSASAAQPLTSIVDVSGTFTNTFDCPFPLEETVSGSIKDMLYLDVDGNPVKEILTAQFGGPVTVSWTNLATGKTLTSHQAAPLTFYYGPDGSPVEARNVGLLFHVAIPGEGNVLLDVGRVVFRRGQGLVFSAGPHQEQSGDTAAFCAALS